MGITTNYVIVDDTGYTSASEMFIYLVDKAYWEKASRVKELIPGLKKERKVQELLSEIREKYERIERFPMGGVLVMIFD